jgi:hypothetical protein
MGYKTTIKIITRRAAIRLIVLADLILVICIWGYFTMIRMPGKSYNGSLLPLSDSELSLQDDLKKDIQMLAGQIGERNVLNYKKYCIAADYIETSLSQAGYAVERQEYKAEGEVCYNIEAEKKGTKLPGQIIIIGAHYDSVYGCAGANDNASAVAAAIALARYFADKKTERTLRFVLFANEEPPFFQTEQMGSLVYAQRCRARQDDIAGVIVLETIGYYSDKSGSQKYPFPFNLIYPSTGDFIGFIGNRSSRSLLYRTIESFRRNCKFPSQGGAIPEFVPGIGWSDHWSFWQQGYPAIMVTDTAPFRYPFYHTTEDTPEKIDYEKLARVVSGMRDVISDLAGREK